MLTSASTRKNVFVLIIIASVACCLSVLSFQNSLQTSNEIRKIALEDTTTRAKDEAYDLSRIVVNKMDSVTTNLEVLASAPSIQAGRVEDIDQVFDAAQYSTEDITEYYMWLDSDGSIASASNIARASYQYNTMWQSEKPQFLTESQKTASIYYSSIVHSTTDNAERLYISYPIVYTLQQDQNSVGDFRGVIVASIRLDTLGGILTNELSPTFDSDVSLTDTSGEMIYSVETSVIGENIFENPVYLTTPILSELGDDTSSQVSDFLKKTNTEKRSHVTNIVADGKTVTIASYPIVQKGSHYWTLYITAPHIFTNNIDALLEKQDTYTTMTLVIIASVSIGLAYLTVSWNKRLDGIVRERTTQLNESNASLLRANDELGRANEQLLVHANLQREFVNIAAHELRTPIMPILGLSDLLESRFHQSKNDEIVLKKSDFDIMSRNSRRLERLATDILDVSRIETQSLHLNLELFDLHDLIQHTVNDVKNQFPNQNLEYVVRAEEGIHLQGDKSKISQVLWNLLNNAAKFTDQGKVTVTCQKKESDGQDKVILSISDTGIGIDSDILPRLFTKFTNRAGTDRNQVGVGLGLYIAKGIIEAHGGKIWVENNKRDGKGSTFWVQMPLPAKTLAEKQS